MNNDAGQKIIPVHGRRADRSRTHDGSSRGEVRDGESKPGIVGEGGPHTFRGEHARKRRSAGARSRHHAGHEGARLGCGDGTTALPEAKLCADVLGVDIARNLVEAGNARAQAAGLTNLRFQFGDATNLQDLQDKTFDL
jgi:Methyltransferase domain